MMVLMWPVSNAITHASHAVIQIIAPLVILPFFASITLSPDFAIASATIMNKITRAILALTPALPAIIVTHALLAILH